MEELPKEINRYGLQYFPVLTIDERTIIYTKRDSNSQGADEDIVFSVKSDSGWTMAQSLSDKINSDQNEGASTVSADGRTLIFTSCDDGRTYGSCDLFISQKVGNEWSEPVNLGAVVNSSSWDSQPSLSADGRTLYFSSNRPGGYGKRDIWVSRYDKDKWSVPVNLGESINGSDDEITPTIHANGQLLFFSSKSHLGLGGYDLFYSTKQNKIWEPAVNLSYPINTHNDEISIYVTPNGRFALYAKETQESGRVIKSEIVKTKLLSGFLDVKPTSYITGRVFDEESGVSLHANLKLMNLQDSAEVYITSSDPSSGVYFLSITANTRYGVFIDMKNYLFDNLSIESKDNSILNPDTIDIALKPIKVGNSIVLENLYFDFDSYHLTENSQQELKELSAYLKENPELSFVIEGHTDASGANDYNHSLSLKRAQQVVDYLSAHGIAKTRMRAVGYGSTKPVSNETSLSRSAVDRRIVFRIVE